MVITPGPGAVCCAPHPQPLRAFPGIVLWPSSDLLGRQICCSQPLCSSLCLCVSQFPLCALKLPGLCLSLRLYLSVSPTSCLSLPVFNPSCVSLAVSLSLSCLSVSVCLSASLGVSLPVSLSFPQFFSLSLFVSVPDPVAVHSPRGCPKQTGKSAKPTLDSLFPPVAPSEPPASHPLPQPSQPGHEQLRGMTM